MQGTGTVFIFNIVNIAKTLDSCSRLQLGGVRPGLRSVSRIGAKRNELSKVFP